VPLAEEEARLRQEESRNKRIFEMWLACYTQEAIGEKENVTEQAVALISQEFLDLEKLVKPEQAAAEHATEFEVPLYNVCWTRNSYRKKNGKCSRHEGTAAAQYTGATRGCLPEKVR